MISIDKNKIFHIMDFNSLEYKILWNYIWNSTGIKLMYRKGREAFKVSFKYAIPFIQML